MLVHETRLRPGSRAQTWRLRCSAGRVSPARVGLARRSAVRFVGHRRL